MGGGESCWEGGRRGKAGAGSSSSEGSGISWRWEVAPVPEADLVEAGAPPPSTRASDAAGPRFDEVGEVAGREASDSGSAATGADGICFADADKGDLDWSPSVISI